MLAEATDQRLMEGGMEPGTPVLYLTSTEHGGFKNVCAGGWEPTFDSPSLKRACTVTSTC